MKVMGGAICWWRGMNKLSASGGGSPPSLSMENPASCNLVQKEKDFPSPVQMMEF